MVSCLLVGSTVGFLAFRARRTVLAFHDRQNRITTKDVAQLDRAQMGVYLYDLGYFRRRVLRLLPAILVDQLRRCLLGMDVDTGLFRATGRILRVPVEKGDSAGLKDISGIIAAERYPGSRPVGYGHRHVLQWSRVCR